MLLVKISLWVDLAKPEKSLFIDFILVSSEKYQYLRISSFSSECDTFYCGEAEAGLSTDIYSISIETYYTFRYR